MDCILKVTNDCFKLIKSGQKELIHHSFSRNKKYTRLFNDISHVLLKNEITGEILRRGLVCIRVVEEGGKKFFEIKLA
jgi:hypothetical protein